jgi:hypothetical protein
MKRNWRQTCFIERGLKLCLNNPILRDSLFDYQPVREFTSVNRRYWSTYYRDRHIKNKNIYTHFNNIYEEYLTLNNFSDYSVLSYNQMMHYASNIPFIRDKLKEKLKNKK